MIGHSSCTERVFKPCLQSNYLATSSARNKISFAIGILASLGAGATCAVAICFTATAFTAVAIASFATLTITCTVAAYWIATMQPLDLGQEATTEVPTHENLKLTIQDPIQEALLQKLNACVTLEEFCTDKALVNESSFKQNRQLQKLIWNFLERIVEAVGLDSEQAQTCLRFLERQGFLPQEIETARSKHKQNQEDVEEELDKVCNTYEADKQTYQTEFNCELERIIELLPEVNDRDTLIQHMPETIEKIKKEKIELRMEIARMHEKEFTEQFLSIPSTIAKHKGELQEKLYSLTRQKNKILKADPENRKIALKKELVAFTEQQKTLERRLQAQKAYEESEARMMELAKKVKDLELRKAELERIVADCDASKLSPSILGELREISLLEQNLNTATNSFSYSQEDLLTCVELQAELDNIKARQTGLLKENKHLKHELKNLIQINKEIKDCQQNIHNATFNFTSIIQNTFKGPRAENAIKMMEMEGHISRLEKQITTLEQCDLDLNSAKQAFELSCDKIEKEKDAAITKIYSTADQMKHAIIQGLVPDQYSSSKKI